MFEDIMMNRLDDMVESGEMTKAEAREEWYEYQAQQYMADHFDMNGDPYTDFLGNPW